ncbi:MAG: ABC transporter permease [Candidatus Margulisbacteria bacterium]|nr:ABC transporter permease [Candidatus Margulisiibacteriota bacterium]
MIQRILYLVQKEFRQVFREKANLAIIFVMPFIQLVILGFAITTNVKNLDMVIVNKDLTDYNHEIIDAFSSTDIFNVLGVINSQQSALADLNSGRIKAAVIIPEDFTRQLKSGQTPQLQAVFDGVDGNSAGVAAGYVTQIVGRLQKTWLQEKSVYTASRPRAIHQINLVPRMLYNDNLESSFNIVPGVLAMLLTMITLFLTAVNIVREKEKGTLEQLLVTPIKGGELILGKIIPYAVLGFILLNVGILTSGIIFGIWIKGNLILLYLLSIIYMMTTLGLGILFSTVARTQLQAMMMAFFYSFFSIMLSGFFIPIENMPDVIQAFTYCMPLRYFMQVTRGIFLKASGLSALWPEMVMLTIFGVGILVVASLRFRKRLN